MPPYQTDVIPDEAQQQMLSQWIMSQNAFKETLLVLEDHDNRLSADDVSSILAIRQKITQAQVLP